jgi:mannose-6-phosphate isomerase-like protein (cupin superfamily)
MSLAETTQPAHLEPGAGRRMRVVADLITIKATTEQTAGAFALVEIETPPGAGFPLHAQHYDDATYLVLDGAYRFRIGDETVELGPGGCAFVPRGTPQGFANGGPKAARLLAIASPGGVWERFLDEIGDDAERGPWGLDMARLLAVAPKYGIEIHQDADGADTGGAPG